MNFWWGIIACLLPVGIGIYGQYLARQQLSRKRLGWDVTFESPLLAVSELVKDRVQVTVDGKRVDDLHIVTLKVWNAGNTPIRRDDYERPVRFAFGDGVEVLQVLAGNDSTGAVESVESVEMPSKSSVQLQRRLLNAGEEISLAVMLTGYRHDQAITCDAHIAGATVMRRPPVDAPNSLVGCGLLLLTLPLGLLFTAALIWAATTLPRSATDILMTIFPWMFGLAFAILGVLFAAKLVRDVLNWWHASRWK